MIDWSEDGSAAWGGAAEETREPWATDAEAWRQGCRREGAGDGDVADGWRGGLHYDDWPEWSAGPEYHMWRRLAENGDAEDAG